MEFVLHALALIGIYSVAVLSLDLLVTHAGLVSLAHIGIMLAGGYGFAIATDELGVHWVGALAMCSVLGVLTGWILSLVTYGLRSDRFVLVTFAVHVFLVAVAQAWVSVTGGPGGIAGIHAIAGGSTNPGRASIVIWLCVAIQWIIAHRLIHSPLGRLIHVFREDEDVLTLAGFDHIRVKQRLLCVASGGAAVSGALFAGYIQYLEPTSFALMDSVLLVAALMIGGLGSPWANVLGVIFLVAIPEVLRIATDFRQLLMSLALLIVILYRPTGFFGNKDLVQKVLS